MTQSTHYPSATYDGETLFLIEGTLSELQVAQTKASLLAQIEKNSQSKKRNRYSRCSPRMHAMVANSEALVFFDHDDPDKGIYNYNFAAAVGEHILCGVMEHANNFHNGEPVKAVVSRRGDVLFAHAIMQVKTLKFYMPRGEYAGREALFKSRKRTAFWLASLTSISFPVMFYFVRMLDEQKNNISYKV
ncbi:hypothetical protein [Pseudoduganella sp. R-34]|uniref:hypothetical protein n=1 Tax=Pseudoduganella sp. R-34 TaxID=3404062 RepID=UPI003CF7C1FE